MTIVVDISCPACGRSEPVRKQALDAYVCEHCGHEFSPADVEP